MEGQTLISRLAAIPWGPRIAYNEDERAKLERATAGQSLNSYVKERLFAGGGSRKGAFKDYAALARTLSLLGRSDIQTCLTALQLEIEKEQLATSKDLERDIRAACNMVKMIRAELVTAL